MELNEKQKEVYDFLLEFTKTNGYPPSVREICKAVSLKSTSTVHGHLKRLEKRVLYIEIQQNLELLLLMKYH